MSGLTLHCDGHRGSADFGDMNLVIAGSEMRLVCNDCLGRGFLNMPAAGNHRIPTPPPRDARYARGKAAASIATPMAECGLDFLGGADDTGTITLEQYHRAQAR